MALDLDQIKRIARLARIETSEAEGQATLAPLNRILGLIETMLAVDTSAVAPMSHAQDVALRLREDHVTEADQRALFQSVAPAVEDGLYLVPKVIE